METFKNIKVVKLSSLAVRDFVDALNKKEFNSEFIESIEDKSETGFPEEFKKMEMKRARVHFKNGLALSVIIGESSYGGKRGLFEIMLFDEAKLNLPEWANELTENPDGFLSESKVIDYIEKIGALK
jgi:hypothetical protein